jgi:hypothetical protein
MRERHGDFHERSHSATDAQKASWRMTQQYMDFQAQLIQNLKLRSQANQERLQSEITLVLLPFKDSYHIGFGVLGLISSRPTM